MVGNPHETDREPVARVAKRRGITASA